MPQMQKSKNKKEKEAGKSLSPSLSLFFVVRRGIEPLLPE